MEYVTVEGRKQCAMRKMTSRYFALNKTGLSDVKQRVSSGDPRPKVEEKQMVHGEKPWIEALERLYVQLRPEGNKNVDIDAADHYHSNSLVMG